MGQTKPMSNGKEKYHQTSNTEILTFQWTGFIDILFLQLLTIKSGLSLILKLSWYFGMWTFCPDTLKMSFQIVFSRKWRVWVSLFAAHYHKDRIPPVAKNYLDDHLSGLMTVGAVHLEEVFLIWQVPAQDAIACHHLITWFDVSRQCLRWDGRSKTSKGQKSCHPRKRPRQIFGFYSHDSQNLK